MCKNPLEQFVEKPVFALLTALCVCVLVVADCSVSYSSGSAGWFGLSGEFPHFWERLSEGWAPPGWLLNPGEATAAHVQTAEGWLMAKWPSRWTSTAPTPRRPSRTTTSTRAASNLHTCTCKSPTCCQQHLDRVGTFISSWFYLTVATNLKPSLGKKKWFLVMVGSR